MRAHSEAWFSEINNCVKRLNLGDNAFKFCILVLHRAVEPWPFPSILVMCARSAQVMSIFISCPHSDI